ncbi:MAG: type I-U CRISPR-associated protein Cas5/Cas6 [Deltaproteobacteria bacterium]|nr:MAG: type I-U CRISPR-associated protein Cas5/Cas6 [Deltaproteobacteria bacterium]TMQ12218.1 MAG: type I-U CRISPR-associated protein Cas5/Cas6 [Deltaproteobacteria bacterium]
MTAALCITARLLQPYSHGRGEDGLPEWPPSPLRLFQALVACSIGRQFDPDSRARIAAALGWLERQPPPEIVAPRAVKAAAPYRIYVPDNLGDDVARAWSKGNDASLANYRTEKDIRSMRLDGEAVHYIFRADDEVELHVAMLCAAARSMTHLGWGIDMVAGDAGRGTDGISGERWIPGKPGGRMLRCAISGTLNALERRHAQFLQRLEGGVFRPVSPLTVFAAYPYARATDTAPRPFAAFRLLDPKQGKLCMYEPTRRARDVAAWLRHAVSDVCDGWPFGPIGTVVHGHGPTPGAQSVARFSFLPLPTISPLRVEGITRVIVVASAGMEAELSWVRIRLAGQELVWKQQPVALLEPLPSGDTVVQRYVAASDRWSTVTPVVLPGHDDCSARKAERLLRRAFLQAGFESEVVDGIKELEWRKVGFQRGVDLASRYLPPDKVHGPLFHVLVRFSSPRTGPIAVGAGRHRGMGIFAIDPT